MKRRRGFTLIEIVVAVALLSVAMLLAYSIFGQGLRLYAEESKSANDQSNVRQVLSDITNKARLTDPEAISYDGVLHVGSNSYSFEDQTIKRNGASIAKDIASFEVSITGDLLEITITSITGKSISTSISLLG
jgi:prepilin-type N-terminal cleavage/methylation domain-containing protein